MYQRILCLLLVFFGLIPALAMAEAIPRSGSNDRRVRIATYQDGQVYRLSVSLTHVTTVEFGDGESIRSIIAGDTPRFELGSSLVCSRCRNDQE